MPRGKAGDPELYQVPYTFSDPLVCAATLDKAVAKLVAAEDCLRRVCGCAVCWDIAR